MESFDYRKHWLISLILILIIAYLGYRVQSVLNPLLFALGVAYVFNPFIVFFERRGFSRIFVVCILFTFFLVIMVVLALGIVEAVNQVIKFSDWLAEKFPIIIDRLEKKFPERFSEQMGNTIDTVVETITAHSGQIAQYTLNTIISVVSSVFVLVNLIILIPLYTFFFMWRFDRVIRFLEHCIPPDYRPQVVSLVKKFDQILSAFFRGRLVVCLFVAITTGLGFALVGIPFAWVLGIYIGVLNILPYVPIFFGLPVALLVAYLGYFDFIHPLYAFLIFSVIQFLDGFVLTPIIQGRTLGLHPITTVVVLFIGPKLAGMFGLLLAIPVAAIIKVLAREFLWPDFATSADMTDSQPIAPEDSS